MWAGQSWDELCHTFDFAAAARKIGMLMTINGTNDDLIRVDGVEKYTFTDADAGDLPANEASDDDDDEEEEEEDEEEEEEEDEQDEQDEQEQGRTGGAVALDDSEVTMKRVRRPRPTPLMTTRRMIQLIPSNYYHLLVQRRLRQDIRSSSRIVPES